MKLNVVLVLILAAAASLVGASYFETNAQRMARGLPPLPPVRRATPVAAAKRSRPSGTHGYCNNGSLQCCNSVSSFDARSASGLSQVLGMTIPVDIPVGLACSPITALGIGQHTCHQQTVCCNDNTYNGFLAFGCSPVKIL